MNEPAIGTLNEKSLHADLKSWYAQPGDRLEQPVDGFVIDIVRGALLIEIQTRGFSAMRRKLTKLLVSHEVRLVHPVTAQKWLVKLAEQANGKPQRRKSPKRNGVEAIFRELVSFPQLMTLPGFSLEVLLTHEEEVRRFDGRQGWRRNGWVTEERRLLSVAGRELFVSPAELARLLPDELPAQFTTADLATAIGQPRRLAQQMTYCLRKLDQLVIVGKQGRAQLYERCA